MGVKKGLIIVYTGNGKGKTTSAMGIAFRACGYKMHTAMIQFIKGSMYYGELESAKLLAPYFSLYPMGKGFVGIRGDKLSLEEHAEAAKEALRMAREKMLSGDFKIIICDEINNAVNLKLITANDVINLINDKPDSVHLILTGRNADARVVELADLVTEMKEIKHPFSKGIEAQEGIDF